MLNKIPTGKTGVWGTRPRVWRVRGGVW